MTFQRRRLSDRITSGFFLGAVAATVLVSPNLASAQTAKVIKVQGRKAIVQFPDEARPRVGQTIDLGGPVSIDGSSSSRSTSVNTGDRGTIIGGSTELSSLSVSGDSSSTTTLTFDGRYGWNEGIMEYGAVGGLTYFSTSATSRRRLDAGGFFDYNLVPNTPGTEIVYGGMALAKFGHISSTTGTTERTGTVLTLEVGGQLKWFPLGNSVAVRGDVLYRMESVADTVKSFTTGSGLVAKAGFYIYF